MSRRGLTVAGLAVLVLAVGCSSGGDDRSAETLSSPTASEDDERDLAACVAIVDSGEARICHAAALSHLMRRRR